MLAQNVISKWIWLVLVCLVVYAFGLYYFHFGTLTTKDNVDQSVFSETVAHSLHIHKNKSANFPSHIPLENCFENLKLNTQSKQSKCIFHETKCGLDNTQFEPDFSLRPWPSLEHDHGTMVMGSWSPCDCEPVSILAIIIPFRQRVLHLNMFLHNIIPFLQYQRQAFTIFVVEHTHDIQFNRGASFNAAYKEISKLHPGYDCFIIHDVDMINENLCNYYQCGDRPRHLSVSVEKTGYRLPYYQYVGGVVAMSKPVLEAINGFTNLLYGWGGEDDNLYARFYGNGLRVDRYSESIGRYASLSHEQAETFKRIKGKVRA